MLNLNCTEELRAYNRQLDETSEKLHDFVPDGVDSFYRTMGKVPQWFMRNPFGILGAFTGHLSENHRVFLEARAAIHQKGMVAPYLTRYQWEAYERWVGAERLVQECHYAFCKELPLGDYAAQRVRQWHNFRPDYWVEGREVTLYRLDELPALPAALPSRVSEALPSRVSDARPAPLAASPVASPVSSSVAPLGGSETVAAPSGYAPNNVFVAPTTPEKAQRDIATSLAEFLQSTLIVGQPGAGKGMLMAMAIREVKRLHPDIQIWAIDPKGADSEFSRWAPCDKYLPLKLSPFASEAEVARATELCDVLIKDFSALGNVPKLLIVDEALALKEKSPKWFKGLMSGFNSLCSMGRESRSYGWLVSQSPNTDDFGISGGVRNVYRRILVMSETNLGLLDNGSTFFSGKPSRETLGTTGRVFFDSITGNWGSIPAWEIPQVPVVPVTVPQREPQPAGTSRRMSLERSLLKEMSPVGLQTPTTQPDPSDFFAPDPDLSGVPSEKSPDKFSQLLEKLNGEPQRELRELVEWLSKRKGEEITLNKVKDSWARHAGVERSSSHLLSLLGIAKSQKLLEVLPNKNWMVSRG